MLVMVTLLSDGVCSEVKEFTACTSIRGKSFSIMVLLSCIIYFYDVPLLSLSFYVLSLFEILIEQL